MSKRVRTPNLEATIRERARAGLSNRAIAKELGVSRQTVDRALAEATPAPSARTAPRIDREGPVATPEPSDPSGAAVTSAGALDRDGLVAMSVSLAEGLTAAARQAQDNGDMAAYGALAGKAQQVISALARLAPPAAADEREGEYVKHSDMAKAAESARAKLLERVARTAAKGAM